VGIAQELGKIERKLEIAFSPPQWEGPSFDWGDLWLAIRGLADFLKAQADGGTYEISSPCIKEGLPGSASDPLTRSWSGSWGPTGQVIARIDALAGLLQDHKNLKQPNCVEPKRQEGEPVTITFLSDEASPDGERPLRKKFNYRDQSGAPLGAHVQHWQSFVWQAGPVCVIHKGGPWGTPQVWAASAAEGKRVINHAAAIAGVDTEAEGTEWIVSGTPDNRYGKPGTMRVSRKGGVWWVTKRPGPSGRGAVAEIRADGP
jgi:hypothetical protein